MNVACIQPKINSERDKCYSEVEFLLKRLLKNYSSCQIACLPERWVPFQDQIKNNFQKERGSDYNFIKSLAKSYGINILSGAIWEKRKSDKKPYITCYYFNEKGIEIGRQDKLHLYTYERIYFNSGKKLKIFSNNDVKFCILICFDMAFYETPRAAVENGADILFSPTQIRAEGMENWEIYLKARALENRIPVVGCNSFGNILNREFWGRSKIISFLDGYITPSKLKVSEAPNRENGYIFDDVDIQFARKIRKDRLGEKIDMKNIQIEEI